MLLNSTIKAKRNYGDKIKGGGDYSANQEIIMAIEDSVLCDVVIVL